MKKHLLLFAACSFLTVANAQLQTFNYSGSLDSIQIPNCVDSVIINLWGAQGANAVIGGTGGKGAYVTGALDVTPGDWLYINVGGQNGYNGGGVGGTNGWIDFTPTLHGGTGGNGGGASDVRVGGTTLNDRIIVAGGGGGGGYEGVWTGCQPASPAGNGGEGSGIDGTTGSSFACGCGGGGGFGGTTATISAGGIAGATNSGFCGTPATLGSDGSFGIGGAGNPNYDNGNGGGGGGGGGYYGGGAGGQGYNTTPGGGGGGGSSYTGGIIGGNVTAGIRSGNGLVTITFVQSTPIMTTSVGLSGVTLTALESSATYQWLNCGTGYSVIPGATNQSFTPSSNGTYAVQLNNGNGCIDTSACTAITEVGIGELEPLSSQVYPNPADDKVQVKLNGNFSQINVVIFDMKGTIVYQSTQTSNTFILNIEVLNSGVYLLQLNADEKFISNTQLIKN